MAPSNITLPFSSTPSLQPLPSNYSIAIVWHIVSATFAWCILPQLTYLVTAIVQCSLATRRNLHGFTFFVIAVLTLQAYSIAAVYSDRKTVPPQHALLTSLLVALTLLQVGKSALMPPWQSTQYIDRSAWANFHMFSGIILMAFALFVVSHSNAIFHVQGDLGLFISASVYFGVAAYALLAIGLLVYRCRAISRSSFPKPDILGVKEADIFVLDDDYEPLPTDDNEPTSRSG